MNMQKEIAEIQKAAQALRIQTRVTTPGRSVGSYRTAWSGEGFEFHKLRSYATGDDIRFVDWSSSARSGYMLVRDYYDEQNRAFVILLDASASMQFTSCSVFKIDMAAQIASTLAYTCYMNGDAVGYMGFSSRIDWHVRPARKQAHVYRMIFHMLQRKKQASGQASLSHALSTLSHQYHRPVTVICISDFLQDHYERELRICRQRHHVIPICIRDAQEQALDVPHDITLHDPEMGDTLSIDQELSRLYASWMESYNNELMRIMKRCGVIPCICLTRDAWLSRLRYYIHG